MTLSTSSADEWLSCANWDNEETFRTQVRTTPERFAKKQKEKWSGVRDGRVCAVVDGLTSGTSCVSWNWRRRCQRCGRSSASPRVSSAGLVGFGSGCWTYHAHMQQRRNRKRCAAREAHSCDVGMAWPEVDGESQRQQTGEVANMIEGNIRKVSLHHANRRVALAEARKWDAFLRKFVRDFMEKSTACAGRLTYRTPNGHHGASAHLTKVDACNIRAALQILQESHDAHRTISR